MGRTKSTEFGVSSDAQGVYETDLVIVTTDNNDIVRDAAEILVGFLVTDVASAQNLLDLARDEKFLELGGEIMNSVRDVQVANDEY